MRLDKKRKTSTGGRHRSNKHRHAQRPNPEVTDPQLCPPPPRSVSRLLREKNGNFGPLPSCLLLAACCLLLPRSRSLSIEFRTGHPSKASVRVRLGLTNTSSFARPWISLSTHQCQPGGLTWSPLPAALIARQLVRPSGRVQSRLILARDSPSCVDPGRS